MDFCEILGSENNLSVTLCAAQLSFYIVRVKKGWGLDKCIRTLVSSFSYLLYIGREDVVLRLVLRAEYF